MRRRPNHPPRARFAARALRLTIALSVGLVACSTSDPVSIPPGSDAFDVPTSMPESTTTAPADTIPPATTVDITTTVHHTGATTIDDCAPPLQFRDIDGDGFGVCFGQDGVPQAPLGPNIVDVPGSASIVFQNVNATVEVDLCQGNGAAGTLDIDGKVVNLGNTIDRGSVDLHMLDTDGVMATVAASLVLMATGARARLDFQATATGSPARSVGEVQVCWFDSVEDVTFFTVL